MRKISFVFAVLLFCILLVSSGSAKLTPPVELKEVFMNVLRLEDLLEDKNWEVVTPMAENFMSSLASVTQTIKTDLGNELWCDPTERFQKVNQAVKARDFELAYKGQIDFQICLFGIMDSYAYKFHPSLLALNKYLDEAIEACEKRKADVVRKEMDEIQEIYAKARPSLTEGKIPDKVIAGFEEGIEGVRTSLARGDYEASHKTLWDMKKALDGMLQMLNM